MFEKDPALLEHKYYQDEFDASFFIDEVKKGIPDLERTTGWIRSGMRIAPEFRDRISSFRLIAEYKSGSGGAKIEAIMVKPRPGEKIETALKPCVELIKWYMRESGVSAVYTALATSAGEGWHSMLIRSSSKNDLRIPDDILDFMATSAIKLYLSKKCGVSSAALDGYFAEGYVLFDDSVIKSKAGAIDRALASVKVCDISCGSGQLLTAAAKKIASVRRGLNRYIGGGPARTESVFTAQCVKESLYATDLAPAALELAKLNLKLLAGSDTEIPEGRFVNGNILLDELFGGAKFDIVLTNPPHMRQEEFSQIKSAFENYEVFHEGADLYCYFAERAFACAADGGAVGLFLSNRWMRAAYGEPLRKFLASKNITELVDYGNLPVLDNAVTPMSIILAENGPANDKTRVTEVNDLAHERIAEVAYEDSSKKDLSSLGSEPWVFESKGESEVMEKVAARGVPLEEYCGYKVRRGILTGLNKAFTVDRETAEKIMSADGNSAKLIKPFLSGRDVKRYEPARAKKYLLFIPNGMTGKIETESGDERTPWENFKTAYPAVASHLSQFKEEAEKRSDKGTFWWELRACKYYDIFERDKIILPMIVKRVSATLDSEVTFSNDKTIVIDSGDLYLLGVLNSTLMDFYVRHIAPRLLNDHYELRRAVLAELPIREISETNSFHVKLRATIEENAKSLLELHLKPAEEWDDETASQALEHEREINGAVFKLYRMTPSDIKIINNY